MTALGAMAAALALASGDPVPPRPQIAEPADVRTVAQTPVEEADAADPLTLEIAYTVDTFANARGGIRRGARYMDNLGVVATADLEQLAGVPRTTATLFVIHNNGAAFSRDVLGDAQVVSGIETGVKATRLYQAWVEHRGPGERWSIKAGIYDVNSEFDALETGNPFVHSAFGMGTDIAQSGANGPSTFPTTTLAVRADAKLDERLTVRVALVDGVPNDPARPARTLIRLGHAEGAMVIGEFDLSLGAVRMLLGGWHYTTHADDELDGALGEVRHGARRDAGVYLRGEAQLSGTAARGLRAFARLGLADPHANAFGAFVSGGLLWRGLVPGRGDDDTGIAFASAIAGADQRAAARALDGRAEGAETAIELTHRIAVSRWLSIQPDVQYVIDPGLDPTLRNALAVGVRVALAFTL